MWHVFGRRERHAELWWGNLIGLGRTRRRRKDILKWLLRNEHCMTWKEFICLRIGTGGGLL
jgi:hypothetical protein